MTLAISHDCSVASRESIELLSDLYGEPQESDDKSVTWNCGKFKRIVLVDEVTEPIFSD